MGKASGRWAEVRQSFRQVQRTKVGLRWGEVAVGWEEPRWAGLRWEGHTLQVSGNLFRPGFSTHDVSRMLTSAGTTYLVWLWSHKCDRQTPQDTISQQERTLGVPELYDSTHCCIKCLFLKL